MTTVTVRTATSEDAPAIGRIHVDGWRSAYRGQMPDSYLDGLTAEQRAAQWHRGLSGPGEPASVLVAVRDGAVIGFAATGRLQEAPATGELQALYVAPPEWGRGAGRALLVAATARLHHRGFTDAVLWVLPGNARARRFYEAGSWVDDGFQRTAQVLGVVVPEVRYRRRLDIVIDS